MFRVTAVLLALAALPQASGTITIHARADGARIPASLYGIFFGATQVAKIDIADKA